MNRQLLTIIIILISCAQINGQGFSKEFSEYYQGIPYCQTFDEIQDYCKKNGFTISKNIYDSSLIDFSVEYSKAQSFSVDIAHHSISVSWAFYWPIDDNLILQKVLVFRRVYWFSKDSIYSQVKYDSYLNDLYSTYVRDFAQKHHRFYSSDIYDPNLSVVGKHTLFNLGKFKGSKYYFDILFMGNSITQNLIREM